MKIFLLSITVILALYGFVRYVLPVLHRLSLNVYLLCLSDEKAENYFFRQFEKYKRDHDKYNDAYVEAYIEVVQNSLEYWNERLRAVNEDLASCLCDEKLTELEEEQRQCLQKYNYWNNAYIRVSNDLSVRQYHATLRNS